MCAAPVPPVYRRHAGRWTALLLALALAGCGRSPSRAPQPNPPEGPAPAAESLAAAQRLGEVAPRPISGAMLAKVARANAASPGAAASPVPTPSRTRCATGKSFAVATAHPLATKAAEDTLARGGTAVDALVAASFMLTVVTPQSTGIGGGGFAIVWPGRSAATKSARAFALDFREQAPAAGRRAHYLGDDGRAVPKRSQRHGLAVGVPGYVAGLWALHRRWGKRPWAELVAPAVRVAERGFVMGPPVLDAASSVWDQLHPNAKVLLSRSGVPPKKGAVLRQPALGKTLRKIGVDGPKGFYGGAVAKDIVATVRQTGGHLSEADLAGYKPRWRAPLTGKVLAPWPGAPAGSGVTRPLTVYTMPQPSAGGAQLLTLFEQLADILALAKTDRCSDGSESIANLDTNPAATHALVEVMRRAFQLRLAFSGDTPTPAKTLDEVYPAKFRAQLRKTFDANKATKSTRLGTGRKLEGHANTSHVSIIDADGMAVSSTHTVNLLFGSGIVAPKSGVWLNNELDDFSFTLKDSNYFGLAGSKANLFRPGARPVSSMSPAIVVEPRGVALVIGSPGGTRIPTAVFQAAWRHLFAGQPLGPAVDAPRLHHQAFPDEVWVQEGEGVKRWKSALEKLGHKTVTKAPWCDVQAVARRWPAPQGKAAARCPRKPAAVRKPAFLRKIVKKEELGRALDKLTAAGAATKLFREAPPGMTPRCKAGNGQVYKAVSDVRGEGSAAAR